MRTAPEGRASRLRRVRARIDQIEAFHRERLREVCLLCADPRTIAEVATALFGAQEGYRAIQAIEAASACIASLHARGQLRIRITNVAHAPDPVIRYQTR